MHDCIFCRIVDGEIPATVVHQNERFLAFRDIEPQAPTHIIVIPREHVRSLADAHDQNMLGGIFAFARDIAASQGIVEDGYRVVTNVNDHGGQAVHHLHLHVLGGRQMQWPPG